MEKDIGFHREGRMFLGVGNSRTKLVPHQVLDKIKKILAVTGTAHINKFIYRYGHLFALMDYRTRICWMSRNGRILICGQEEPHVFGINRWNIYNSRYELIVCKHEISRIPWSFLETKRNEVSCTTYNLDLLSYYFSKKYPLISDSHDLRGFFSFTAYKDCMDAFLIDIDQKKAVYARIKRPEEKRLDFFLTLRLHNYSRRVRVKVDGEQHWVKPVEDGETDIIMVHNYITRGVASTARKKLYLLETKILNVVVDQGKMKWHGIGKGILC